MFDIHCVPHDWGIVSTIFGLPSYSVMVGLGIFIGGTYCFVFAKRQALNGEHTLVVVISALLFGMLGAKIPSILMNFHEVNLNPGLLFEGKTIVGGFIGGALGVLLVKRMLKIKIKMGNVIAPAAALGLCIGRIGCFLTGCCYGVVWKWGVDFGDGLLRLPTQLFESAFHLIAFFILNYYRKRVTVPGILFRYYITAYFIFRIMIEFIRENEKLWGIITLYQLLAALGLLVIYKRNIREGWNTLVSGMLKKE